MFRNKWLLLAFCVNTAMFVLGMWQLAANVDPNTISFNGKELGTCHMDVLPFPEEEDLSDAQAHWKSLSDWCETYVWTEPVERSFLQQAYIWVNDATVQKCERFRECNGDLMLWTCLSLTFVLVTSAVDYLLIARGCFGVETQKPRPEHPAQLAPPRPALVLALFADLNPIVRERAFGF